MVRSELEIYLTRVLSFHHTWGLLKSSIDNNSQVSLLEEVFNWNLSSKLHEAIIAQFWTRTSRKGMGLGASHPFQSP